MGLDNQSQTETNFFRERKFENTSVEIAYDSLLSSFAVNRKFRQRVFSGEYKTIIAAPGSCPEALAKIIAGLTNELERREYNIENNPPSNVQLVTYEDGISIAEAVKKHVSENQNKDKRILLVVDDPENAVGISLRNQLINQIKNNKLNTNFDTLSVDIKVPKIKDLFKNPLEKIGRDIFFPQKLTIILHERDVPFVLEADITKAVNQILRLKSNFL